MSILVPKYELLRASGGGGFISGSAPAFGRNRKGVIAFGGSVNASNGCKAVGAAYACGDIPAGNGNAG